MTLQGYWSDLKAPDFKALPDDLVVVLPVGATEQHGPHLPISVDATLVDEVAKRALSELEKTQSVLVLPTLAVSKSGEHDNHPGTLSLSAETLIAVFRDIGASLSRAGVKRLMILNGHGGNTAVLEIITRDLRMAHGMVVAQGTWFGFAQYDGVIDDDELRHDIHAGDSETSPMLAIAPERVEMEKAENFGSALQDWEKSYPNIGISGQPARPGWIIDDLSDSGACGNAAAATPEKGEALLSSAGKNFAKFLKEFASFDLRGRSDD